MSWSAGWCAAPSSTGGPPPRAFPPHGNRGRTGRACPVRKRASAGYRDGALAPLVRKLPLTTEGASCMDTVTELSCDVRELVDRRLAGLLDQEVGRLGFLDEADISLVREFLTSFVLE